MLYRRYYLGIIKGRYEEKYSSRDELVHIHNKWIKKISGGVKPCFPINHYLYFDKNKNITSPNFKHRYFVDNENLWKYQNPVDKKTRKNPYLHLLSQDIFDECLDKDRIIENKFMDLAYDFEIFEFTKDTRNRTVTQRLQYLHEAWREYVDDEKGFEAYEERDKLFKDIISSLKK